MSLKLTLSETSTYPILASYSGTNFVEFKPVFNWHSLSAKTATLHPGKRLVSFVKAVFATSESIFKKLKVMN